MTAALVPARASLLIAGQGARLPPILRGIYHAYIEHFGEPAHGIVFEDGINLDSFPPRVDVLIWDADDDCEMTTFATIGMAALSLPRVSHREELHFAVRMLVSEEQRQKVAQFLANLAMYPFQIGEALDWWHTLSNPGDVPLFPTPKCVLLHPRFVKEGWDTIVTAEAEIHLLNVVPITREEKELRNTAAIRDRLAERDMFDPW